MFEYAISNGEGTLLDHGIAADVGELTDVQFHVEQAGYTMIYGPAGADTQTGR